MKKALDYVNDYQLKSACKDAICIAPSKDTRMIFAVLEDWYHHIILTHSCKQESFLRILISKAATLRNGKYAERIFIYFGVKNKTYIRN